MMQQIQILCIDDDPRMENLFRRLLYEKKYALTIENSGKRGIEHLKKIRPDIIFCDILMPEMDGYEVLSYVRQHEETHSTKFVFITALDGTNNLLTGISRGADGYLTKPINRGELLEAIEIY